MAPSADHRRPHIELLVWGENKNAVSSWPLGNIHRAGASAAGLNKAARAALVQQPDGILFWDSSLGVPNDYEISEVWRRPGDLWHAGLKLGTTGLPSAIDYVHPTWTLNCDPDATMEATSWRLSLRACLMRRDVLEKMGPFNENFEALAAAALEFGHRCISFGVFTRHIPWLAHPTPPECPTKIPLLDAFLFVRLRFGQKWLRWALLRAVMSGELGIMDAWRYLDKLRDVSGHLETLPYRTLDPSASQTLPRRARVSVVIPTVDRYPYLRVLLRQLRTQTHPPAEILVVDQTSIERRYPDLFQEFEDLPLRVYYLDQPGQCSSRNLAIRESTGEYLLFIDDDDEVNPSLIADHLRSLAYWNADVSSGVADEVGAGPLPANFRHIRLSDVFPTNNSMIRRSVLANSGLFDLAYERGQRADGDLGTRMYLSGAVMVLNPNIHVLHHHAPAGGLRKHKARVQTYAQSRQSLWVRQLPSATEYYLGARYFNSRQCRECEWIRLLGTFSVRGSLMRRFLKLLISAVFLPRTLRTFQRRRKEGERMLATFPCIPEL